MDPVSIGAAAAALLTAKFGEGFAGEAGANAWTAVRKLRELVLGRFHREAGAVEIAELAAADSGFGRQVEQLLDAAGTVPGARLLIAQATGHAKQINISGDNHGPITL